MISDKYAALHSYLKKYMKSNFTLTLRKYSLFLYTVKPSNITAGIYFFNVSFENTIATCGI